MEYQYQYEYQSESENELIDVHWRLLWQDPLYLDGTVPAEEAQYILSPVRPAQVSSYAADPCPQTRRWEAPRLKNQIERVQKSKPMPGQKNTALGAVACNSPHKAPRN